MEAAKSGLVVPVETTTWRFLLGFYQVEEAVNVVKSLGLPLTPQDESDLRAKATKARLLVESAPVRTKTVPRILDVPEAHHEYLRKLEAESTFPECTTGMKGWGWRLVELGSLRTFQPSVNWDYVQTLVARAPESSDADAVLKFCLPLAGTGGLQRVVVSFNQVNNTYSIVSEHLDLRIVGQVQGEDQATKRKFFGFATGFGLPTLTVAHYRDMYLLKNGYHRAVALLAKGHRYVPALVVETYSYQMTGAGGSGFFTVDILSSTKPPLLSDFLSQAAIDAQRPKLRTVLTVHGEGQALAL